MAKFNLRRFRELAFGQQPVPDHPLRDLGEARKLLALLPQGDPASSLADLTRWTLSMNETDSFTPGRRARILLLLDDRARSEWRALGARFLAPHGKPLEHHEGDPSILRAMFDSASEFANGFALVLDYPVHSSQWVVQNQARLQVRSMRWLGRRLALAHMLGVPHIETIWEQLHRRRDLAALRGQATVALPAFEGVKYNSSVNREYLRALLLELAAPDALNARQIELVYRIAARVASAARLSAEPGESTFGLVADGGARPVPVARLKPGARPPLYINTASCLPRLRGALERDAGQDPQGEDNLYGRGFTLQERNRVVRRLLEYWGPKPPQRRNPRVPLALKARLVSGYDMVVGVVPSIETSQSKGAPAAGRINRMALSQTSRTLKRARLRAAQAGTARLIDASAGGLGLAVRRSDAVWARHGMLLGVLLESSNDWIVGILQRIYSMDDELRLGIQILSGKPRKVLLRPANVAEGSVWEEAVRYEKDVDQKYRLAILLEAQSLPLPAGDLLLPPGAAASGTQLNVPLPLGEQRIGIKRLDIDNKFFQRASFEPLDRHR